MSHPGWHRGLTDELRLRLRLTGIAIETNAAQDILSGADYFGSVVQGWVTDIRHTIMTNRHALMKAWEESHPGQPAFPPVFALGVMEIARRGSQGDLDPIDCCHQIVSLCETELNN